MHVLTDRQSAHSMARLVPQRASWPMRKTHGWRHLDRPVPRGKSNDVLVVVVMTMMMTTMLKDANVSLTFTDSRVPSLV